MKTYIQLIKELNLSNPSAALTFQPKKKDKSAKSSGGGKPCKTCQQKSQQSQGAMPGQGPQVKGTSGAEEAMKDVAGARKKGRQQKSIFKGMG